MKNSPISDASRVAALALSASAPANSFMSSLPSRTLVSLAGCGPCRLLLVLAAAAAASCPRAALRQQRLAVGQLPGVGDLPAGGHHVAEAARGVVDPAGFGRGRRWCVGIRGGARWDRRRAAGALGSARWRGRVGIGRRRRRSIRVGRWTLQERVARGRRIRRGRRLRVGGATDGSVSATTVAPASAAIASVFARRLRCSGIASGSSMQTKLQCCCRDASVGWS